jgi:excisionase family DNA binding protein
VLGPRENNRLVWLTVFQAAKELGVSRQRVHQLLKEGALTGQKEGTIWIISARSVQQRVSFLREEREFYRGRR